MAKRKKQPKKRQLANQVKHLQHQIANAANVIRTAKERINRYDDPEWVKEFVSKERELCEKRIANQEQRAKNYQDQLDQILHTPQDEAA